MMMMMTTWFGKTLKTVGIKATISECTLTLVISVLVILQHTLFWRNRPPHLG